MSLASAMASSSVSKRTRGDGPEDLLVQDGVVLADPSQDGGAVEERTGGMGFAAHQHPGTGGGRLLHQLGHLAGGGRADERAYLGAFPYAVPTLKSAPRRQLVSAKAS